MNSIIYIALALILVDNVVLTQLYGTEVLFAKFKSNKEMLLYALSVFLISLIAGIVAISIYSLLNMIGMGLASTFFTVLISFGVVMLQKFILPKISNVLTDVFIENIPILSINCVVLISVQICATKSLNFGNSILVLLASIVGFIISFFIIESIKEKIDSKKVSLLILALSFAALAFSGFIGIGL